MFQSKGMTQNIIFPQAASQIRGLHHQPQWAVTSKGRYLELYHSDVISGSKSHAPSVLFVGGVHGDEPEGVKLAQELLNWLQKEHKQKHLHPWMLIPCLNVDGFANSSRTNARHVDLNRNFPTQDWTHDIAASTGAATTAQNLSRYYSGPRAGSEIEVQALVKLIHEQDFRLIVHFHSWEPSIVYTGPSDLKAAHLLKEGNDYDVRPDIGYKTPGSLGNYGWLEKKIPVICIEEQEKISLEQVWPHFKNGLIRLLTEAF